MHKSAPPSDGPEMERHRRRVSSLCSSACYPHPATDIEHIETHISDVLLAGDYAYKLKKPVALGFLDFTTLAARRHFCHEELRLNRRTAPRLYQAVVALRATSQGLRWDADADPVPGSEKSEGASEALDYAVRMRRFPAEALFDAMLRAGTLRGVHVDALAARVAAFHETVARSTPDDPHGRPAEVLAAVRRNFETLRNAPVDAATRTILDSLERWSVARYETLAPVLAERKAAGFVRECHGDLHSGNIAWVDDDAMPFDCIEFNAPFRWIDVASEVAFVVMDLQAHGRADLAARFLDRWLEASGDDAGLAVLDWFAVYRALVRAAVAAIRLSQDGVDAATRDAELASIDRHVALAKSLALPRHPAIVITHGFSGSGKTTAAQRVVEAFGSVRVRSDVERKRLHGLAPDAASGSSPDGGIYTASATDATYARLAERVRSILASGRVAVVDASFLSLARRERFASLARESGSPFAILELSADESTLRERIRRRGAIGNDASEATEAVLARQLAHADPLTQAERACSVRVDGDDDRWLAALGERLGRHLDGQAVAR
ncbi:MAG: AAA family ATPase [Burkholderiaceae bacterium]|nr:AAA family ATPase [Burkholderiaceae bacterium]